MRLPKTDCPRCNSRQRFFPKRRPVGEDDTLEVYIRCGVCRWEKVLRLTSKDLDHAQGMLMKANAKADREIERYGSVTTMTATLVKRWTERHRLTRQDFEARMEKTSGATQAH